MEKEDRLKAQCGDLDEKNKSAYSSHQDLHIDSDKSLSEPLYAVPQIKPVDMGFFAGVLDYSKLSTIVRMVMKSKMKKKGVPQGDHHNWDTIGSWAEGLSSKVLSV